MSPGALGSLREAWHTHGWQWGVESGWSLFLLEDPRNCLAGQASGELLDPSTSLGQSCVCGHVQGGWDLENALTLSHTGREEPPSEPLLMAPSIPTFMALLREL